MNKVEAFKIVYEEFKQCSLLMGIYDAKNGNEHFMYGVGTVMEAIAANISEETQREFSKTFYKNMDESEEKAKKKE